MVSMIDKPKPNPVNAGSDTKDAITAILSPQSVVVVGASDARPGSMPAAPVSNLLDHGFGGRLYVVNPNRDRVSGVETYATLDALPEVPDTAIVVVAADRVPNVVRELGDMGVLSATIVAAGFGETGSSGELRTNALVGAMRESGIRLLGPNTTGVINTLDSYVPRASRNHPRELTAGSLAIVGQSGALGNGVFNRALLYGVGVGYVIATGNQLDLDVWDITGHILLDDRVSAVAMLIESVVNPTKIAEIARLSRERRKPLIALRLGVSERGKDVVATHSGSLAGASSVAATVFAEEGIIEVHELDSLWEVAQLFQTWGPPASHSDRIAVISTSGGDAALAADIADNTSLVLPEPHPKTVDSIRSAFSFAASSNPFDLTAEFMGRPGQIEAAVRAFTDDPNFDALIFSSLVTVGSYTEPMYREVAAALSDGQPRRVAVALRSGLEFNPAGLASLQKRSIPVFEGVERALYAIDSYARYFSLVDFVDDKRLANHEPEDQMPSTLQSTRSYWADRKTLVDLGVSFNAARIVESVDGAVEAAEDIGYPVVLKVSAPGSGHKFAMGGVRLLISTENDLRSASTEMINGLTFATDLSAGFGLVVERQMASVAEVFVGFSRDDVFGPVAVVGMGGVWAEEYRDTASLRWPATPRRFAHSFESTRIGNALSKRLNVIPPLYELVRTVGDWFVTNDVLASVDINPVLLSGAGELTAIDARLGLSILPRK